MSEPIIVDGVRYISTAEAALRASLSADYISQFCRQGKIRATQAGRNWLVDPDSLDAYLAAQNELKQRRCDALSAELRAVAESTGAKSKTTTAPNFAIVPSFLPPELTQRRKHSHLVRNTLALAFAIALSFGTAAAASGDPSAFAQNAMGDVSQIAALPLRIVFSADGYIGARYGEHPAAVAAAIAAFENPVSATSATSSSPLTSATPIATAANGDSQQPPYAPPSPPQIERIVEQPIIEQAANSSSAASGFVTKSDLNGVLAAFGNIVSLLPNAISQQTFSAQASPPLGGGGSNTIAAANAIDQLSGTSLNNVTVNGISGLTASDIPSDIVAANYLPLAGGTLAGMLNAPLIVASSTTLTNLFATDASTTDATSTNLFANSFSAGTISVSGTTTLAGVTLNQNCSSYGNGGKLTTDAFGDVICAADQGDSGSTVGGADTEVQFNSAGSFTGSSAFTFATSTQTLSVTGASTTDLLATNATSTDLFATLGHFTTGVINALSGTTLSYVAASTSNFSNFGTAYFGATATSSFDSAGQLTLANLASAVLGVSSSGQVVATTSIGTNLLTGTLGTVNGTALPAGGSITITAASSTLLASGNTWTGLQSLANASSTLTTLGTTWLSGISNSLLATNALGQIVATTTIGTNALTGTVGIGNGGTGIASTPSYGQLLVGNGSGYALAATSSLGLPTFANLLSELSAAYPFAFSGNATSTLTQFNGGLTAFASSTIGNGNQNGGLTVSGGATTTGNATVGGTFTVTGNTTLANATSTDLFSTLASSTNLFSQTAALGALTANSLTLNAPLAIASGGTNATSYTSGQLLAYNGTSFVSTSTIGNNQLANSTIGATSPNSTLTFGAAAALGSTFTADLNRAHSNWWTAAQNFTNASTSELTATSSVYLTNTEGAVLSTNGSGLVQNTTVSSPLSFSGSTLSISQANSSTNGYLASTDWTTFNNKVSSTSLSGASVISYTSGTGVITTTGGTFGSGSYTFPSNLTVTGNATTTDFFATTASSTNIFAQTASLGSLSLGSALSTTNGGSGQSSVTTGDLLYGSGSNAWSRLGIGAGGYVLGVVNGVPAWVATTTLSNISGTLGIGSGGTGNTSFTKNGITYGNGTILTSTASSASSILVTNSSGVPSLSATLPSGLTIPSPTITLDPTGSTVSPAPSQADIDARGSMSVEDFGAKCDTFVSNTVALYLNPSGSVSSGSTLFTSTSGVFSLSSVGKSISIAGAGAAGAVLGTTIASYVSPTQVNLATSASNTVSDTNFSFGTDDTAAIQAAINWASTSPLSRRLLVPPGAVCGVTSTVTIAANNVDMEGSQQSGVPYDTAIGPSPITSGFAWVGGPGGTIMSIAPTSGTSNPGLAGVTLRGLAFGANNLAQVGLDVSGLRDGVFDGLYFQEGTTASFFVHGGNYALGGYCGVQFSSFTNISAFQYTAPGIPILEEANNAGTCNPSENYWQNISVVDNTENGIELLGADNEYFVQVGVGTFWGNTPYSIYFGTEGGYSANTNYFTKLSATDRAYADTGTYDDWFFLDKGNSTPDPIGPGTVHWTDSNGLLNNMQWAPNVGIGSTIFTPAWEVDIQAPGGSNVGRVRLADQDTGAGATGDQPTFEAIGARDDSNGSFEGRFAAAFRRTDGTAIAANTTIGALAFGGQYGTSTTFQPSQILYPASIQGIAEGSFTSGTAMPTGIAFFTGSTGQDIGAPNNTYGTERMRIANGGNVGVGTTSPGSLFSVGNTNGINFSTATSSFSSTGGINLAAGCFAIGGNCLTLGSFSGTIGNNQLANSSLTVAASSGLSGGGSVSLGGSTSLSLNLANANSWTGLQTFANASTTLFSAYGPAYFGATATSSFSNAGVLSLVSNGLSVGTNQLVVSGGKVGIGTTAFGAGAKLDVSGGYFYLNNSDYVDGSAGSALVASLGASSGSTYSQIQAYTGGRTGAGNLILQPIIGNVGIGTTSPQTLLGLQGGIGVNSSQLYLAANGNVGIGTSTPYSRLAVWGPDTASTSAFTVINSASTTDFNVLDNGNATLSGSLTQNSDQRLKTNIEPLDASSSLSLINELNPVTFNWIDPNKGTTPQLGFIAQQVLPIFPNLISTTSPTALTPDGTLSLNYIGLISPIVSAIQALNQELSSLVSTVSGFAQSFVSGQITASQQLCVGSTCVTPAQFQAMVAAANISQSSGQGSDAAQSSNASTTPDTPPVIQINGDNPAVVQLGNTYNDLGATITGPQQDLNLDIATYLNGSLTSNIVLDTSEPATDTIDYVAADHNGLTSTSTRTVLIEPAAAPSIVPTDDASTTAPTVATSTATTTTQ